MSSRMHVDEVSTDASLVRRLLAAQFPKWAGLRVEPVASAGTDNALYRLGGGMVVRMPRIHWAVGQVDKEHEWLPKLAPHLPLAVPIPLARGEPGEGYPWRWSIYRWLDGEDAAFESLADPGRAARKLARFVAALRRVDAAGGPAPGRHNSGRGVPLATRDEPVRAALAALRGALDTEAAARAWEAALRAPEWRGPPAWIHGDLRPGNLLAQRGRLTAVIDFGCLGVGDPACDLMVAWNFLTAETRAEFRASLAADDASWARGRGWALSTGLIALPYYRSTNPTLAGISRRTIEQVLADDGASG